MASKRRNMFDQDKKKETTKIVWPDATAWKPNTRYDYLLQGRAMNGLNLEADQYSRIFIRGKVFTQLISENALSVEVKAEYANVHTNLSDGWGSEIRQESLLWIPMPLSGKPFELKLTKGVISGMAVDKSLPTWEANWYKSIASQLQVDTGATNLKQSLINQKPTVETPIGVYKTMEDDVSGKCEKLYDLTIWPMYLLQWRPYLAPIPDLKGEDGNIIEVVKTTNYSACEGLPNYHFGFLSDKDFNPVQFLDRTSVSRIVISGKINKYTIQSSVSTSEVILSPHMCNGQKGIMASSLNLTLQSVTPGSATAPTRLQSPRAIASLVYEFNAASDDLQLRGHELKGQSPECSNKGEYKMEREIGQWGLQGRPKPAGAPDSPLLPLFVGLGGNSIQSPADAERKAREIAAQMGAEVRSPNSMTGQRTLSKFALLVRLLRTMNVDQLVRTSEALHFPLLRASNHSATHSVRHNTWAVFRDAVARSGTGPALLATIEWIKKRAVTGREAAQVVEALEYARQPTEEYLNLLFELVKRKEVADQEHLNTSALMSFTSLVRKTMVDRHAARGLYPICGLPSKNTSVVVDKYILYLSRKLKQAVEEGESRRIQTYSIALGNVGHYEVLRIFEDYLQGKLPVTQFQRLVMVTSLQRVAMIHPARTLPVLVRLYTNTGETPEVRTAAVMLIMRCDPPVELLQRMAETTNSEPSSQVRSAVKAAIQSAAGLDSPRYSRLSQRAKAAVHLLDSKDYGVQYSKHYMGSKTVLNQNIAYKHALTYIQSLDGLIPSSVFCNLRKSLGGLKKGMNHMSYMTSSSDDLIRTINNAFHETTQKEKRRSKFEKEKWTFDNVEEMLNVQTNPEPQVEGNARFNLFGSPLLFTWDNKDVQSMPRDIIQVAKSLRGGKAFNLTKWYDPGPVELAFPTSLGFPFVFTLENPTYFHAGGEVSINSNPPLSKFEMPKAINSSAEIRLVYSSTTHATFGFVTPFNQLHYLVGLDTNFHLYSPVGVKIDVVPKKSVSSNIYLLQHENNPKFLEHSAVAYSTIHSLLDLTPPVQSINARQIHIRPSEKFSATVGKHIDVTAVTEEGPVDLASLYRHFERHDPISAILFATHEMNIHNTNVTAVYNPTQSMARSVAINLAYEEHNFKNGNVKHPDAKSRSSSHPKGNQQELLWKASEGLNNSRARMLDMTVNFEGTVYRAAGAYAASELSNRNRLLIFASQSSQPTSHNGKPSQLTLNVTAQYPKVPILNYKRALRAESDSRLDAHMSLGAAHVHLKGSLVKTQEMVKYLENCPLAKLCLRQMNEGNHISPACRASTSKANYQNRFNFKIDYEKIPGYAKNLTYYAYSLLRQSGFSRVVENFVDVRSGKGKVSVDVQVAPSLETVDVSLETPLLATNFNNIRIHPWMKQFVVPHPEYGVFERFLYKSLMARNTPVCAVDNSYATTFDNRTYPIHLGQCWYAMFHHARDSSSTSAVDAKDITVLVRDAQHGQKDVKIVFDGYEVNLESRGGIPVVTVNGEKLKYSEDGLSEIDDAAGETVLQAYALPEGGVWLYAPQQDIEVIYDGRRVKLLVSNEYRDEVRGLCGNFDGEVFNDFTAPKNCILKNPYEFAASYSLPEKSCQGPAQHLRQKADKATCHEQEVLIGRVSSGKGAKAQSRHPNYVSGAKPGCTKYQAYVIKQGGKFCSSIRPQIACSITCKPTRRVEKLLQFHCVAEGVTAHQLLLDVLAKGDNAALASMKPNHSARVTLPEQCVAM